MSDIEQAVAEALRTTEWWDKGGLDTGHDDGWTSGELASRLLAALAVRGYHVTRSDREARLETALRELVSHLADIGWHEGRTPDFSCMKGEDARRLDDLYDAAEALLSEAPE